MPRKLRTTVAILAAACCLTQSSCSGDTDPVMPASPPGDVWLTVGIRNLEASGAPTRADGAPADGDGHPGETPLEAENYIDIADMGVMLFNSSRELVKSFGSDEFGVTPAGSGVWNLSVRVPLESLGLAAGDAEAGFSVMVVANLHGTGYSDGNFGHRHLFSDMVSLSEERIGFRYLGNEGEGGTLPWEPSIPGRRLIPMSGTVTAKIPVAALEEADSPGKVVTLPTLYMQRAMAQVRLVDALADNGVTDYEITDVKLHGHNTRGTYLPLLADDSPWCFSTSVLEYGTALADWYDTAHPLASIPFTLTDTSGTVMAGKPGRVYSAFRIYVPEFDWDAIGDREGPWLSVTVRDLKNDISLYFDYSFPRRREGLAADADFARNHIYQVVVTGVQTTRPVGFTLSYGVCPWLERTADIPPFK